MCVLRRVHMRNPFSWRNFTPGYAKGEQFDRDGGETKGDQAPGFPGAWSKEKRREKRINGSG